MSQGQKLYSNVRPKTSASPRSRVRARSRVHRTSRRPKRRGYTGRAVIKVYSTRYCGFCVAARRLLQRRGYAFEEVDVSHDNSLRHQVSKRAGNYRTVPMIFIDEDFIGGYEELAVLDQSGELAARTSMPQRVG
jgi:glutaredoxin 3